MTITGLFFASAAIASICAFLVLFPYIIYPLFLRLMPDAPTLVQPPVGAKPRVTMVFCAFNEARVIRDKIKNIENLIGGSKDDTFTGDTKANIFKGLAGKDVFDGKTGLDTADYSEKTAKITVTLKGATQTDVKVGTANEDKIKNIEVIIGGSVADSLTGDDFANVFVGNGGNDTLIGGLGNDTLTGGTGADHFRFNTTPHSTKNVDRITDFAAGRPAIRSPATRSVSSTTRLRTSSGTMPTAKPAAAPVPSRSRSSTARWRAWHWVIS